MAISSNTLFHFTKEFDTLINILESGGFWARYCKEYGWIKNFAVPIACFCDIPLTQISEHTSTFGHYGIGLSQEWRGKNNQICPVFYLTENSPAKSILNTLRQFSLKDKPLPQEVEEANYRFFSLIKKYKGEGKDKKIKILYNEKEWRYIPNIPYKESIIWKDKCNSDNEYDAKIDASHIKTREHLATFTVNDIRYLIIEKEEERIELIKKIDSIYSGQCSQDELLLLKSKILTCNQIQEDF